MSEKQLSMKEKLLFWKIWTKKKRNRENIKAVVRALTLCVRTWLQKDYLSKQTSSSKNRERESERVKQTDGKINEQMRKKNKN